MTQEGTHLSCCGHTLKGLSGQGGPSSHSQAYCPSPTPIPEGPRVLRLPMLGRLQEEEANSLTADNLEKFGKLSAAPGPPDDGTLLSEAKLQSILSFLDEMEKSGQERPAPWREVVSSQESTRLPVGSVIICKAPRAAKPQALTGLPCHYPGIFSRQVTLSSGWSDVPWPHCLWGVS